MKFKKYIAALAFIMGCALTGCQEDLVKPGDGDDDDDDIFISPPPPRPDDNNLLLDTLDLD